MTDNHDYNVPEEGSTDWHIPLNENFESLDIDVEIRDVEQNLDEYNPKSDAGFLATDTGRFYVGNGSEWVPVPTTGSSPELEAIDGDVVGRSEAITHLAGNIYVTEDTDADPTENDGDLVFYV